ncbi:non-ribosomal peptide synthetase [Amycolatopsis sp. PS_44_ISF1]|uniref:non-ribosomal peptide synthetase n=1 Tax=Amycolatopsis sp. PS_44_ISF1 TaxID=2974917 RepID=UPI0028E02FAB|nr:non-ribosomal peptide synthetase [Amycolatopsis sp. PS_44_ISF1]MDT8913183.1 amino acid adenylation domain-containing protein [Amycolatopsis sp. PS_44_ISF1]
MTSTFARLSPAQEQLWFLWRLRPESDEYNVVKAVRLRGRLEVPALRRALTALAGRHEGLRAVFPEVDGRPVLRIGPPAPVPLAVSAVADGPALDQAVAALVHAPFDLVAGPVLRAHLLRVAEDDHTLVLVLHHIVADGWSVGLIDEELAALYGAVTPLPPPGGGAPEWTASEPGPEEALSYWQRKLAGAPPRSGLPGPRPADPVPGGATCPVPLPAALPALVDAVAARYRVTRTVTLLAAYAGLLARMSATADVVIGVPSSGRAEPALQRVVGLVVTVLPVRVRIGPGLTFAQLLGQVRESLLDGQEHQSARFDRLAGHPLFRTVMSYEEPPAQEPGLPGLSASAVTLPVRTPAFDLVLRVAWPRASFEYRTDVHDAATVAAAADRYARLLAAALEAPDTPVARLPLLSAAEHRELTEDRSAPHPAPPVEALIAARVEAAPEAVAVRTTGEELTYGELDRRAGAVAARLRAAGAGPGTLVAIRLPRGAELVIAHLAVLKSGATGVPLDPAQPPDRLAAILDEAAPLVTLADLDDVRASRPPKDREDRGEVAAPSGGTGTGENTGAAYVVHTSGSTGRPKGVVVEAAALAHLVSWHHREFGLGPRDRTTLIAGPGFDASLWEVFTALSAGATLEVPPAELLSSPGELREWLSQRRITSTFLPTPLLENLLPWTAAHAPRTVLTGGDRLHAVRGPLPFRLVNNYGPTEGTVVATSGPVGAAAGLPPIGHPRPGVGAYVLDAELQPVPDGVTGELYLGGAGLARGYLGRAALTADRFVPHPFAGSPGRRLYRTGDLVRRGPGGALEFLGRNDAQLQVRGFRVEAGEIENVLRTHPRVRDAVVVPEGTGLTAYLVGAEDLSRAELHEHTGRALPSYMRPHRYFVRSGFPLSPNGKVDRTALAAGAAELRADRRGCTTETEELIARVWSAVLGHDAFGPEDNFFDVGGHSLLLTAVSARLRGELGHAVPVTDLYAHPTVAGFARHLDRPAGARPRADHRPGRLPAVRRRARAERTDPLTDTDTHLAVIGLACRFPGAVTPEQFWLNLTGGVDSVRDFSAEELAEWGEDPALSTDPRYVTAHGAVDGFGAFDADFFGITARDAVILNPQHRMFLELAWEVLERAGYDPSAVPGVVGLYAGAGRNGYARLVESLAGRFPGLDELSLSLANEPEHLVTRVSYALGLNGPSVAVQTACSTSLVAVHEAGRALLAGDCDFALAGGVTLRVPRTGYWFKEGGTMSPDGRCKTFSEDARGIVAGDGAGIVVLRRLDDALADGDHVHAVIRGTAVNNDGRRRAGYTAPGVHGQVEVVRLAHSIAEVTPDSVGYVEAHGTGTPVGDPIEVTALAEAFDGVPAGRVALGSVKTNIGHTDTAAGVAGLMKAVLALEHRTLPATLHHTAPNPRIDFASGPFEVTTANREWPGSAAPRRAGVSSFGIGGTNAHAVLEEAPPRPAPARASEAVLLVLSARTPAALSTMATELAAHLRAHPDLPLDDVAATLQRGRHAFAHRWQAACGDAGQALDALAAVTGRESGARPSVVLRFPPISGDLGWSKVFDRFPAFRAAVEQCRAISSEAEAFAMRYALGRLLLDWGVEPETVTGEGTGAVVAACVTGALPLAEGIGRATGENLGSGVLDLEIGDRRVSLTDEGEPLRALLDAVGGLWQAGVRIDWDRVHAGAPRRRVVLPTYPFERQEHLVRPEAVAATPAVAPARATGPVEPVLLRLFQQVLGVAEDVEDPDFFEHGGDSLAAVQLMALVDERFEVALTLEDVFEEPTVRGLAQVVDRYRAEADA